MSAGKIGESGLRLLEEGLTDGTSGNISARHPDQETFLITPSTTDCRLLADRDLIRVHLESGAADGSRPPSSEWRLHAAVYRSRPDAEAVIHDRGTFASAVAVARKTFRAGSALPPSHRGPSARGGSGELRLLLGHDVHLACPSAYSPAVPPQPLTWGPEKRR